MNYSILGLESFYAERIVDSTLYSHSTVDAWGQVTHCHSNSLKSLKSSDLYHIVTLSSRNVNATRQNSTRVVTRHTLINTSNSKSAGMSSPNIDKVTLIRGLNPAQRKGILGSPIICVGLLTLLHSRRARPRCSIADISRSWERKNQGVVHKTRIHRAILFWSDIYSSKGSYI